MSTNEPLIDLTGIRTGMATDWMSGPIAGLGQQLVQASDLPEIVRRALAAKPANTTEALPELPPLPEPSPVPGFYEIDARKAVRYTADQMRDYARAALAATSAPAEPAAAPEVLLTALRFYARGDHYHVDYDQFDTVSGEPQSWLSHSEDPTMIEDGTVARMALHGILGNWIDGGDDDTPQPIDGEVFAAAPQPAPAVPVAAEPWQPIETAAKDPRIRVLLKWVSGASVWICIGAWASIEERPNLKTRYCPLEGWMPDSGTCIPRNQNDCVGWMPLPDARAAHPAPSAAQPEAPAEPLGYVKFRASRTRSPDGNFVGDGHEGFEFCRPDEIGDDKKPAFPVYATHPAAVVVPAELSDEEITQAVVAALRPLTAGNGSPGMWARFTYESGPYSITKIDHVMVSICRAVIAKSKEKAS